MVLRVREVQRREEWTQMMFHCRLGPRDVFSIHSYFFYYLDNIFFRFTIYYVTVYGNYERRVKWAQMMIKCHLGPRNVFPFHLYVRLDFIWCILE